MFGSWFKKKQAWQAPEILGLTIGRAVLFDPVALKLFPKDSLLEAPQDTLLITAQGHCDLGEQSHLHRFYPDDDRYLLQLQGGDGLEDQRVDEIMLWYFIDVQYPSNQSDWVSAKNALRNTHYDLTIDGQIHRFDRAWFDTSSAKEDPMTYWENIVDKRDGHGKRKIFQTAMLFSRFLQDDQEEMLLVNLEESETGEKSIAFMIGRLLQTHEFSV